MKGYDTCYGHRPDLAEERRRSASKGGRAGGRGRAGSREVREIKGLLEDLTSKVIRREISSGVAAVANQLVNTRLRALEQERKIRETEDLETRIEALERTQNAGRGGESGRTRAAP